ncbi:MAG TPA: hypothetical protein VM537_12555 [Anaerolineae bacterium]|nr:hypothetical protein [Anaerolineae bacterium]
MVGAIYRKQAWNAKVTAARLLTDLTALLPNMTIRMAAKTPGLVAMETMTKQVLDDAGVSTIQYPFYLAFAREVYRKQSTQEISGESLALWTATMLAKWVARGLGSPVLTLIRNDVFTIAAPLAP